MPWTFLCRLSTKNHRQIEANPFVPGRGHFYGKISPTQPYNHKAKLPGDHDRGACGLETSSCTSGAIAVPSCAFGPLCAFGPRRQGASVGRRRRSLKLAPLGRPKATASAAQAPQPPLPMDQKDRLRQAATRHGRCSRARDLSSGLALPFCLPGLGAPHTTAFS